MADYDCEICKKEHCWSCDFWTDGWAVYDHKICLDCFHNVVEPLIKLLVKKVCEGSSVQAILDALNMKS